MESICPICGLQFQGSSFNFKRHLQGTKEHLETGEQFKNIGKKHENVTGGLTFPVTDIMNVFPGIFHIRNGLAVFLVKLIRWLCQKLDEKKVNKLDKEKRDELEREIKDLKDAIEQVKQLISEKVYCSK